MTAISRKWPLCDRSLSAVSGRPRFGCERHSRNCGPSSRLEYDAHSVCDSGSRAYPSRAPQEGEVPPIAVVEAFSKSGRHTATRRGSGRLGVQNFRIAHILKFCVLRNQAFRALSLVKCRDSRRRLHTHR